MFNILARIRNDKIEDSELKPGDVLGYPDGSDTRYFLVRTYTPSSYSTLTIKEISSSGRYEPNPSELGNTERYGGSFDYDLISAKRNFTTVSSLYDRTLKFHFCKVVAGIMFATNELKELLVELEI